MFYKTVLPFFLATGTTNDTTNQQSLFNFVGKTQKKSIEKNEKDSRKVNDNKTSLRTKRVCEDLERIAIDKKQKIEKIHKELGQSNRQFSSTTVTDTKELDQSNRLLSSTTVTDTTIEESENKIYFAFIKIFSDIKTEQIHNYYRHISSQDLAAMSKDNKFQHNWLSDPKYNYCEKTKAWSLVYIYGKGMFCSLCRIFDKKQQKGFKTCKT